ncbi:MAG: hypothetical protein JWN25_1511 [Verrucomicrobiales bacterium]|nr:hypothetical protein [Verrucomicrobiales bacterium]
MKNGRINLLKPLAILTGFLVFNAIHPTYAADAKPKQAPGLIAAFKTEKQTDVSVVPNLLLYVPAGKPFAPFIEPGLFSTVYEGNISVDLRGEYIFQVELNGEVKLEINGVVVLESKGKGELGAPSKSIRLNKGLNPLKATYSAPPQGDAFVRLNWKPSDSFMQPIPPSSLSHSESDALNSSAKLHLGRDLVFEHRCLKCHEGPREDQAAPEVAMDAPSFEGIGQRRNPEWMARWIADPKTIRPAARMPKLLHGAGAKEDAEAIAAFLGTLKTDGEVPAKDPDESQAELGQKLFEGLHCVACHTSPDTKDLDVAKIPLKQVREKFSPGSLAQFLKKPDAHYAWIRMPQFKLTDEQRSQIVSFLIKNADAPRDTKINAEKANTDKGQMLVQTLGCLKCHNLKLENQFKAKDFAAIPPDKWDQGCLSEKTMDTSKAPDYSFNSEERGALRAFGATDRLALSRHIPADFAERQVRNLNCMNCHGQFDGFPRLELLGGKLRPEWSAKFIAGEIPYKPRTWLEAQMPAFTRRADLLSQGLAAQHGLSPQSSTEPANDPAAAEIGHRLVSPPPLGFACISCHSVGSFSATEVFEAPGINLAISGERLLPQYAKRWIRSPTSIDPTSKMPVYFDDEGKSPLADVYGGSGEKQVNALWEYIRLGSKMALPKNDH